MENVTTTGQQQVEKARAVSEKHILEFQESSSTRITRFISIYFARIERGPIKSDKEILRTGLPFEAMLNIDFSSSNVIELIYVARYEEDTIAFMVKMLKKTHLDNVNLLFFFDSDGSHPVTGNE